MSELFADHRLYFVIAFIVTLFYYIKGSPNIGSARVTLVLFGAAILFTIPVLLIPNQPRVGDTIIILLYSTFVGVTLASGVAFLLHQFVKEKKPEPEPAPPPLPRPPVAPEAPKQTAEEKIAKILDRNRR